MGISRNTGITHGITHKITSNTVLFRNMGILSHYGYYANDFQGELFG